MSSRGYELSLVTSPAKVGRDVCRVLCVKESEQCYFYVLRKVSNVIFMC